MNKYTLDDHLNLAPLYRPFGLPSEDEDIALITFIDDIPHIEELLNSNPHLSLKRIAIFKQDGKRQTILDKLELCINGQLTVVPVGTIHDIKSLPHLTKIVFATSQTELWAHMFLFEGLNEYYLMIPKNDKLHHDTGIRTDYYDQHKAKLNIIYSMLQDDDSRNVMVGRIKGIITGNNGYNLFSPYPQYFHPKVSPAQGDVVIDAGISAYVDSEIQISRTVGPAGRIIGFEPVPSQFKSATNSLAAVENTLLLSSGLGENKGNFHFVD